jgi:hypothetical protein
VPSGFDTVLVVDFGAQYAQLIARRVRECQVYSEIVPAGTPAQDLLARQPAAVILSGGPASVYAPGAPPAPDGLFTAGIPVLGICYGFQLMVRDLGGEVARTGAGEYGAAALELAGPAAAAAGRAPRQPGLTGPGAGAAAEGASLRGRRAARPPARDAGRWLFSPLPDGGRRGAMDVGLAGRTAAPAAEISQSGTPRLLASGSTPMPMNARPVAARARMGAECSPTPPVKTTVSSPPMAAAIAATVPRRRWR